MTEPLLSVTEVLLAVATVCSATALMLRAGTSVMVQAQRLMAAAIQLSDLIRQVGRGGALPPDE